MNLEQLVAERSLIVCVGPGGVGKTTVSAALGLAGARAGRRTAVLTIDPARRLADALGLPALDDEIRPVPTAAALGLPGELHAAMVETAASYDALIRRVAEDPATAQRILDNRIYQAAKRSMARSHAYVAMERLYDAAVNLGFDLVVLDTPPARNALDILDAPRQLASFLDARIVGWFLPNTQGRRLAERLLARGGEMAKRLLGMVTGETLLDELLEFLSAFSDLREGFAKRAQYIDDLLRAPSTAFILVSSASPASADDAAWLREDLDRRKVPVDAVVFNQSYQVLDPTRPREAIESVRTSDIEAHVARLAPHLQGTTGVRDLLVAMRQLRVDAGQDNARCQRVVAGLSAELPPGCPRIHVPRLGDEIRDLDGLARLVEFLLPPVPPV